jgi:hypothetical protein
LGCDRPNGSFFTKRFSSLQVSDIVIVQPQGSCVSSQCVGERLELTYANAKVEHYFVACSPCLGTGTQASWKVTINKLPTNCWLYLGLIGTTVASNLSYSAPTSFGWAGSSKVYVAGQRKDSLDGWTSFTEGECLHFVLKETKLTMYSVFKNLRFVIEGVPSVGEKFIHFNFCQSGTKVTLEPLSESEFNKVVSC